MGYLSCNAESAIAACDSHYWPDLKRKSNKHKRNQRKPPKIREFSHEELVAATNDFSAESFLGKGSHGSVYKAILDDGKLVVAVKRTKLIHNPKTTSLSFHENEIEILSRVRHPRLVNLIGFCNDKSDSRNDSKLIVVEYMPKGSLYDILHTGSRPPSWTRRVRFGLQVAKAVHALHASSPPVIHRDIKSSNVLIDEEGNARLGDFGLALRGHVEDVRVKCTPPAGTLGYLDPGYLAPGDLSPKSDVFSFGILLLEIISGRNAIDVNYSPPSIVDWAGPIIKRGDYAHICDFRIGPPPDPAVARNLAVLAARCVRSTAEKRPAMTEVVECLKFISKQAHAPPMWNNLRRRVRCVEINTEPLLGRHREVYEETEVEPAAASEAVAEVSRRSRKVIQTNNNRSSVEVGKIVRSKSIGSFREMLEVAQERNIPVAIVGKRASGVTVKIPPAVVRLRKSRSVGVSRVKRSGGFVLEFEKDVASRSKLAGDQFDLSELVISLDEKSDDKMLQKPLVSQ